MIRLIEKELKNGWTLFTLTNGKIDISFINYGCAITAIHVPNNVGIKENVVLAYESIEQYKENPLYLGTIIGRVAGRIKNAEFTLENQTYKLDHNDGKHHLHGGHISLHNQLWKHQTEKSDSVVKVVFSLNSQHADNGYPGNVSFIVSYSLTVDGIFRIDYEAETDRATPITLTNHTYFNLSDNKKSIHDHCLRAPVSQYLELNDELIAERLVDIVEDSPFNFRNERDLRSGLSSDENQIKIVGGGYDHYFQFQQNKQKTINVHDKNSGREMIVKTDEPGFVIYTTNNVSDQPIALQSGVAAKHMAVCFETQKEPASFWIDDLPTLVIKPNEKYKQYTSFQFLTNN